MQVLKHRNCGVVEKSHVLGLFKNVQMQGAQKSEPRGVYLNTLSGAVCSATQQMSVFQQPPALNSPIYSPFQYRQARR